MTTKKRDVLTNNLVALSSTQTKKPSPKRSPPEQHDVAKSSSSVYRNIRSNTKRRQDVTTTSPSNVIINDMPINHELVGSKCTTCGLSLQKKSMRTPSNYLIQSTTLLFVSSVQKDIKIKLYRIKTNRVNQPNLCATYYSPLRKNELDSECY